MEIDGEQSERWIDVYYAEFRRRFVSLLGFEFAKFTPHMALSLLHMKNQALLAGLSMKHKGNFIEISVVADKTVF